MAPGATARPTVRRRERRLRGVSAYSTEYIQPSFFYNMVFNSYTFMMALIIFLYSFFLYSFHFILYFMFFVLWGVHGTSPFEQVKA